MPRLVAGRWHIRAEQTPSPLSPGGSNWVGWATAPPSRVSEWVGSAALGVRRTGAVPVGEDILYGLVRQFECACRAGSDKWGTLELCYRTG